MASYSETFTGNGPGVFDPNSGYGIDGSDLIWDPDFSEGAYLNGLTIVNGQIAASHNAASNAADEGGGGGIIGPMDSGDVTVTLAASEFSGFTDLISPSTASPGVDPVISLAYLLKVRMIGSTAFYVSFSKQTGNVAEGRGAGWIVEAGATMEQSGPVDGVVLFLGLASSYRREIADLAEGDILGLRVVGQNPTIVTGLVNGSAVFTVNTTTDVNWASDASLGFTEADLPFGAYAGFDITTTAADSAPPAIEFYDTMVRADNFNAADTVVVTNDSPGTFTPPGGNFYPPILPRDGAEQTPLARRLFRHYRPRPEGINVYYLSNGVVTEADPDGEVIRWQQDGSGSVYVVTAWYGGHDNYQVTPAEAAALTDAGYSVT